MKKLIIIASLVATVGVNFSCSDSFFAIEPQGAASLTSLSNKNGVNALLIGAYSLMDGVGAGNTGRQSTISNYVFGGITSGDAVKGTDIGDQPEQEYIEQFNWLSDNTYFLGKWQHSYDGVARANEALMLAKSADVKDMTDAEKAQVIAEAKAGGCTQCGESTPVCLDFHHVGDKDMEVSKMWGMNDERVRKEIEKCILLCSNCHRKVHAGILVIPS